MKRLLAVLVLGMIFFPVTHTMAAPFAPYWPSKEKPILPCSGFYDQAMDPNQGTKLPPCQSLCDFFKLGQNLLNFAYTLLFFVVVPLSFLSGGVMYMLSGPNPGLKKKGNDMMEAAVKGLVVVLVAYAAVNTFFYLLGPKNGASGWGNLNCSVAPMPKEVEVQPPGVQTTGVVTGGCKGATYGNCPPGSNTECRKDPASNQYSCVPIDPNHTCGTQPNGGTCPNGMKCVQNKDTAVWSCEVESEEFTCGKVYGGRTCPNGYTCKQNIDTSVWSCVRN